MLDLDDDGIELNKLSSNKDDGPYFDFDGDDIKTLTGWVGAEDGLLAIDRNNNDKIDNTSELFAATEKNPFKALSRFDTPRHFFFKNGVIDKTDAAFSQLRVWRDYNSDGYPHHTELKKLTDLGITSISTKAKWLRNTKIADNQIRHEGIYSRDNGTQAKIVDVRFKIDPHYTINNQNYNRDIRTEFLPRLNGYGTLKNLIIAQSFDNDDRDSENLLMQNMRLTNSLNLEYLLQNWGKVESDMEKILFRWAGADKINPKSRGPHIDARRLKFYEEYRGEKFRQTGYFEKHFGIDYFGLINPMPYAARYTRAIYAYLLTYFTVDFTMQKLGREIFFKPEYKYNRDRFYDRSLLKPEGIDRIKIIAQNAADADEVWMRVVQIMAYTKGLEYLNAAEIFFLNQAITSSGNIIKSWQDAVTQTEEKYGKIITAPDDWNAWDKSKEWRAKF